MTASGEADVRCNVTVVLDACYTALPGVCAHCVDLGLAIPRWGRTLRQPSGRWARKHRGALLQVDRGHVEYRKLREFISQRPRMRPTMSGYGLTPSHYFHH